MSTKIPQDIYIYKHRQLHGKLNSEGVFILQDGRYIKSNELKNQIEDIMPEGIDLMIMLKAYAQNYSKEFLYPFLKNSIGAFDFSFNDGGLSDINRNYSDLDERKINVLDIQRLRLNVLHESLYPDIDTIYKKELKNNLSISGQQHKLQAFIKDNIVYEGYGDYILKPFNPNFSQLELNEHLHTSFMREFGFEVSLNFIIADEKDKYHYMIKRFDFDKNGNKLEIASFNSFLGGDKYHADLSTLSHYIRDNDLLSIDERVKFLKFIFANSLLYNNDLHKKNISFIKKDNTWSLSPAYDIINTSVYETGFEKCCLSINNKKKDIRIKDFRNVAYNLNIDYKSLTNILNDMIDIYLLKYPLYLNKLSNLDDELADAFYIGYFKNKELYRSDNRISMLKKENQQMNKYLYKKRYKDI